MPISDPKKVLKKLPNKPGVYFFFSSTGKILYIGKALSLKNRVSSYFRGAHDNRIEQMVRTASRVEWQELDSALEALILEANLIRRHKPKYNVLERDDKTFIHIGITQEDFPRVVLVRSTEISNQHFKKIYGPFPSALSARLALKVLRKIFPFRSKCKPFSGRKCLDAHLGLCPGVCVGAISQNEYLHNIRDLILFFEGEKKRLLYRVKKEMNALVLEEKFEEAAKKRDQIFALEHIRDAAFMREEIFGKNSDEKKEPIPSRIEAYDISHTGGQLATGSMVVFSQGEIDNSEYRQFRIKTVQGVNDPAQMAEVLARRFNHTEWPLPELILLDGGLGQLHAVEKILRMHAYEIPLIALAKGPTRKGKKLFPDPSTKKGEAFWKNLTTQFSGIRIELLEALRDESHRFALRYHRKLRKKHFLSS